CSVRQPVALALPARGGVRLSQPIRGLRPAGAGGHAGRSFGGCLPNTRRSRSSGGCRPAVRSPQRRRDCQRAHAPHQRSRASGEPGGSRKGAGGPLYLADHRRADRRGVRGRPVLRVVHVYKDIYPVVGGIENHIRLLCRELARQPDIQPHILVANPRRRSEAGRLDGVPVTRAASLATVASTPLSPRLALELRRLRPDLVHLHFPYPIGEVAALLAVPNVPTMITYHSDIIRQRSLLLLYGPLLRIVLRRARAIIATSGA